MIALLSLISGFLSPFLPDIFKIATTWQDHRHELAMRQLDREIQKELGQIDLQRTLAAGDVQDAISARQMGPTYGLGLLDALSGETGRFMRFIRGSLILALALIEVVNGLVRPGIAYWVMGFWGSVKLARMVLAYQSTVGAGAADWPTALAALATALAAVWEDHDWILVDYVAGFYFGARHRMKESK
jgi:hypothetical protein